MTGAYEYIEKLQRQVQELHYELDSEHDSSVVDFWEDEEFCERSRPVDYSNAAESSCSSCGVCSQPTVSRLVLLYAIEYQYIILFSYRISLFLISADAAVSVALSGGGCEDRGRSENPHRVL